MLRPSGGDKRLKPGCLGPHLWALSLLTASRVLTAALELEGLTPGAFSLPILEWEVLYSLP